MGIITYTSNNSGGSWWLSTEDWEKLEKAGWVVHWIHDPDDPSHSHESKDGGFGPHDHQYNKEHQLTKVTPSGEDWIGAKARSAAVETSDPEGSVREWESIVGQSAGEIGCNCCGVPHSFTYVDDNGKTRHSYLWSLEYLGGNMNEEDKDVSEIESAMNEKEKLDLERKLISQTNNGRVSSVMRDEEQEIIKQARAKGLIP